MTANSNNKMKITLAIIFSGIFLTSCQSTLGKPSITPSVTPPNVTTQSLVSDIMVTTTTTEITKEETVVTTTITAITEETTGDEEYVADDPLIKKAVEILAADKIKAVNNSGKYADVTEDDVDEILLTGKTEDGKSHLYCFMIDNDNVTLGGECEDYDGEDYELEWFRTAKYFLPVAHTSTETDEIYRTLFFVNGKFNSSLLTQKHINPDGTAEYTMGGYTAYSDQEEDYNYKISCIKKQSSQLRQTAFE